ncbi:MAG: TRASH domain-containing protein [Verrucomicrobiota bacterium]
MKPNKLIKISSACLLLIATCVQAAQETNADNINTKLGEYPLKTCVISGAKLGSMGEPYIYKHKGREIQFCCKGCDKAFEEDPNKALKKLNAAVIAQQKKIYPFKDCVVSQEPLIPEELFHFIDQDNNLYLTCCKICPKEIEKSLATYQKMLNNAIKQ